MQTFIKDELRQTPDGKEADRILRSCVHCGFCTATCPTYRLLGDELDGPRGRIYLIKGLLEGKETTGKTLLHLDRCLTCRACETTCPSGVEYGHLLDIGRHHLEQQIKRPLPQRFVRRFLQKTLPYRNRFAALLRLGRLVRPLLPGGIKKRIPPFIEPGPLPGSTHTRKVILFQGCVQAALSPRTNAALMRVLDRLGIMAITVNGEGCCGALDYHMADHASARDYIKNNIDRWWPNLANDNVEAIVTTASGCGVMIKDYGFILRDDPDYAEKAARISALCRDVAEIFTEKDVEKLRRGIHPRESSVVFQEPCTLQHGQKLQGLTARILSGLGFNLNAVREGHICCGSAGVYSLLQPKLSRQLRHDKLSDLLSGDPGMILTANIGCQMHLQQVTEVPVKHWIEEVDQALAD
ncbi:MAG TPA: glycolate oxidase subunit GlcF [Gammaproteobacteria bacterium]|nr:glycolate oxidase subunit GlcF [Gammaproteobacteria bacterium]